MWYWLSLKLLKKDFKIKINDNLTWASIYTKGRIVAGLCKFQKLGFNPIEYLNKNSKIQEGLMYNNYSPGNSDRMYFTAKNAGKIDYYRFQIEKWKTEDKINENEYGYLLACLIEAVSGIANIAGVYGAFLKNWDSRALNLDPPYTQNQYGTQYHLLETLVLNDTPEISEITGSRPTAPMRSDWSKDIKTHILLDKILYETKAKYIILSYNIITDLCQKSS